MALIKSEDTNYGVSATYWHVFTTNVQWKTMRANIVLVGYVDENARRNGKDYVATKSFNVDILPFAMVPIQNMLELGSLVYGIVKYYISEFKDAEDKLEEGQIAIDVSIYLPKEEIYVPPEPDPNFQPYYPEIDPELLAEFNKDLTPPEIKIEPEIKEE